MNVITFRVTILRRHPDGTDWASVHGPFETRAAAGRFAHEAQQEDPDVVTDVVAIGDRGEVVTDRVLPARTPASDAARDQVMAYARDKRITRHVKELEPTIEVPARSNEPAVDPWGNGLAYRGE